MHNIIIESIEQILVSHKPLLKIAIRQKAKFEGWLKFELACQLDKLGMQSVEVETKLDRHRDRQDISFFHEGDFYRLEVRA